MEKISFYEKAKKYFTGQKSGYENDIRNMDAEKRRFKAFARYLDENMPGKLKLRCEVSFGLYGKWNEANISPKYGDEFTEHDTILITSFGAGLSKWKFRKDITGQGKWKHTMERGNWKYGRYVITFYGTSEIDGCRKERIVETKEVVTYKVVCN